MITVVEEKGIVAFFQCTKYDTLFLQLKGWGRAWNGTG